MQTAESLKVKGLSESSTHDNSATINSENCRFKSNTSNRNKVYSRFDNPTSMTFKTEPFSPFKEHSPYISTPKSFNLSSKDKVNTNFPFESKNNLASENNCKFINQSPKAPNLHLSDKNSLGVATICSPQSSGITQSAEHLNFPSDNSATLKSLTTSGEQLRRKRGRPRTLDSDSDVHANYFDLDDDQLGKNHIY